MTFPRAHAVKWQIQNAIPDFDSGQFLPPPCQWLSNISECQNPQRAYSNIDCLSHPRVFDTEVWRRQAKNVHFSNFSGNTDAKETMH